MSFVCPLPPVKVSVRKEYLYDHQRGHGDVCDGVWVSVKSIEGEAFRFETYLPSTGALFDKLPISAFLWQPLDGEDLPLDMLQIWDAMSHHVEVIHKPLICGLRACFLGKDREIRWGEYMFTLDNCNPDPRIPDFGVAETPDEHKSFNLLKLDNGQFALQPNNRCQFHDPSLTYGELGMPDYLVCTHTYSVENKSKWALGEIERFDYERPQSEEWNGTSI